MNILFVCTGNTCRSAMGAAIMKSMLEQSGKNVDAVINSAGVCAMSGQPASYNAAEAVKKYGANLDNHTASVLKKQMIDDADLILTMTGRHKMAVLNLVPEAKDKVFTLKEYSKNITDDNGNSDMDISDPYGEDLEIYEKCAEEIANALNVIINKIF